MDVACSCLVLLQAKSELGKWDYAPKAQTSSASPKSIRIDTGEACCQLEPSTWVIPLTMTMGSSSASRKDWNVPSLSCAGDVGLKIKHQVKTYQFNVVGESAVVVRVIDDDTPV